MRYSLEIKEEAKADIRDVYIVMKINQKGWVNIFLRVWMTIIH